MFKYQVIATVDADPKYSSIKAGYLIYQSKTLVNAQKRAAKFASLKPEIREINQEAKT